ncbi:MAG: flagellar motor switch protein FliG [Clostridia bacterium]|nr:flagellar motor switch protein FliG [Clostridia bacterium]
MKKSSGVMTGSEKAAILLIALGKNYSAKIFKYLREEEIEQLTLDITNLRSVDAEMREAVINEFYELCLAQNYISEGGIEYARQLLEDAFGNERAYELIGKITSSLQVRPFDYLRKVDPEQILSFIRNENTQTIALVFSYLKPQQVALVLGELPPEQQAKIIEKIANMDRTSPEYIKEVERVLERKLSSLGMEDYTVVGGIQSTVDILNSIDMGTEKRILETLDEYNNELAEEIRKRMFTFEDIVKLDARAIQKVLKETDNKDLAVALKGSSKEVKEVVMNNVSARLRDMLTEDIEFMGPVRIKDVEIAQQKIVNTIRHLEEVGEIIIMRGEGDDLFV